MNSNRPLEEMNDHELLMELIEEKRRNQKIRYIKYGILAVAVIVIAIIVSSWIPKIREAIETYNTVMKQVDSATGKINEFMGKIDFSVLEELETTMGDVQDLMGKLQTILGFFGMN